MSVEGLAASNQFGYCIDPPAHFCRQANGLGVDAPLVRSARMLMAYAIKDWNKVFENYRSREIDELNYVSWPVRRNSDAFMFLLSEPGGLEAFGIFAILVQIAARCSPRGTLADDKGDWTPARVAKRVGSDMALVERGFQLLASKDVAWLVGGPSMDDRGSVGGPSVVAHGRPSFLPSDPPSNPSSPSSPSNPARESTPLTGALQSVYWREILKHYPKQCKKLPAIAEIHKAVERIALARYGGDEDQARLWLGQRVESFSVAIRANGAGSRFVPNPDNWFRDGRYDDDPETWASGEEDEGARVAAMLGGKK